MKSVELFCASPASTAICSSMDQRSMVRQGGIRPTDRHSHRLVDPHHRHKTKPLIPCSSQIPITPRPYIEKTKKSTSSPRPSLEYFRRKSSADISDLSNPPPPSGSSRYLLSDTSLLDILSNSEHSSSALVPSKPMRSSSNKHQNLNDYPIFRSSKSSTHSYDNPVYEYSSSGGSNDDFHPHKSSLSRSNYDFHAQRSSLSRLNYDDLHAQKYSLSRLNDDFQAQKSSLSRINTSHGDSKSSLTCTKELHAYKSPSTRGYQVVELKVAIHCKGCEGKIRKHISRMEGVTSFSIDLATKKVTVIGNVTPLGVLTSVSKVKNAEFWQSPPSSSSSSSSPTVGMNLVST